VGGRHAATLADIGERQAIQLVQKILGRRAREAARLDDAAVVRLKDAAKVEVVTTTDTLSFATHRLAGAPLRLFGQFACAVSISDLAAMGARPQGMLMAVGLPPETAVGDLEDLALGFRSACNRWGFDIWGGDLKESPSPYVTGTAVGTVARGTALRRARAIRPGWTVGVTGFVGRAAFGAAIARGGDAVGFDLVYGFEPRVEAGARASALGGAVACIDSSDGLVASLLHLAAVNPGVGFDVDAGALPVYPGLRKAVGPGKALRLCLEWGGDYELVFCAPSRTFERLREALRGTGAPLCQVGQATREEGLFLVEEGGRSRIEGRGWEHFTGAPGEMG